MTDESTSTSNGLPVSSTVLRKLHDRFGAALLSVHARAGDETANVRRETIADVLSFLKTDAELAFELLVDITAVDWFPREPRFEVVYHLLSLSTRRRIRIKTDVPSDDPRLASATPLWGVANWLEREVWDMFGIRFDGHPDLRRILMYEEFEGHPLRKDYPIRKRQPLLEPRIDVHGNI